MRWPRASQLLAVAVLTLSGCGGGLETSYGHVSSKSINGTGVFAGLLRERGHTVRTAVRLTDALKDWADVIVRFAPYGGPPDREEGKWYLNWLTETPDRQMIYVPRDYDSRKDYWDQVIEGFPPGTSDATKGRATRARQDTGSWEELTAGARPKEVADARDWFAVNAIKNPSETAKSLGGPWAEGIDAARAKLPLRETLKVDSETVLLEGNGHALAMEWTRFNGGQVLVVANGSFLLNGSLLLAERRPLAEQAADWLGDEPLRVAFVEGRFVVGAMPEGPSLFGLLNVPPFGWIAAQLLALGLAACLARSPTLGRPRPRPPSGEDRPVAHPEALGLLLARTRQEADARAILDAYVRWRYPTHHARIVEPPPPADLKEKPAKSESLADE